jgi:pilus assembly protein CpaD
MPSDIVDVARRRRATGVAIRSLLVAAFGMALAGCNTAYMSSDPTEGIPLAYQDRHPITIQEGRKALVLFVGSGRGGLSPTQRAEVLAFAHNWQRDATGGVTVDRPIHGDNERAISDTLRETLSILWQAGVPRNGIGIRPYDPHGRVATLRLTYPLMKALAGPCGLWPDDLGPTYNPKHYENMQYYNFGCATQRNLAAMVAEPADLVQPRSETSVYRAKRTFANEKWRKGENPSTVYTDPGKGAISELGK